MGFNQYNLKTDVEVTAEQLTEARSIITPRGIEHGQEGDWEVNFGDGNVQKMTDEEWQKAQGKGDEEKKTEVSGKGISSPGDRESDTKESADEETAGDRGKDSEEDEPETPEKVPPRSSKTTKGTGDDRF